MFPSRALFRNAALAFSLAGATAAAAVAWKTLPVVAATDIRGITYTRDATGWHVTTFICQSVDHTVVTGAPPPQCFNSPVVDIPTPSGAFLTQLKSDAKQTVIAAGLTSGD